MAYRYNYEKSARTYQSPSRRRGLLNAPKPESETSLKGREATIGEAKKGLAATGQTIQKAYEAIEDVDSEALWQTEVVPTFGGVDLRWENSRGATRSPYPKALVESLASSLKMGFSESNGTYSVGSIVTPYAKIIKFAEGLKTGLPTYKAQFLEEFSGKSEEAVAEWEKVQAGWETSVAELEKAALPVQEARAKRGQVLETQKQLYGGK